MFEKCISIRYNLPEYLIVLRHVPTFYNNTCVHLKI